MEIRPCINNIELNCIFLKLDEEEKTVYTPEKSTYLIIFFINKKSGPNQGYKFINLGVEVIRFKNDSEIVLCDLFDDESLKKNIKYLKSQLEKRAILIVIAGGDGSVSKTIDLLLKFEVDI